MYIYSIKCHNDKKEFLTMTFRDTKKLTKDEAWSFCRDMMSTPRSRRGDNYILISVELINYNFKVLELLK